jgi:prepilin-type N-terminal cleavage/methylation domain-containing protein
MKTKTGFTLIELMMVVLVMAIIATLATGGAMKAMELARKRQIESMRVALQGALVNYRAAEERWPLTLMPLAGSTVVEFRENNALVFAPLIETPKNRYLDPSALLTKVPGKGVMPLRKAIELRIAPEECPLGYPDPANKDVFRYFKVTFDFTMDNVSVEQ